MKQDIIVGQYNQTVPAIFNGRDRDPYRVLCSSDSFDDLNTLEQVPNQNQNQKLFRD
jgi:hypothetical protein